MLKVYDDIHNYYDNNVVVVPTNIGWDRSGNNLLIPGLSLRFPGLNKWYGDYCKALRENAHPILYQEELILFPVKPLNRKYPNRSNKGKYDLTLISKSLDYLISRNDSHWQFNRILIPFNNGFELVLSLLEEKLDDRYTLVIKG